MFLIFEKGEEGHLFLKDISQRIFWADENLEILRQLRTDFGQALDFHAGGARDRV